MIPDVDFTKYKKFVILRQLKLNKINIATS
jgi:hypothetical protein